MPHLKDYGFTRTYENTTSYGKYLLLKEKDYIGITGNNGNYDFAINYSKESNQISYFVFSDDPNYPFWVIVIFPFSCLLSVLHMETPSIMYFDWALLQKLSMADAYCVRAWDISSYPI